MSISRESGTEARDESVAAMRTIAIVNQKGGCGKTTTTVNLAGSLADQGARVLVVDLDPQAHATLALGIDPESVEENLYEVLAEADGVSRLAEVIVPVTDRLHVAPSGIVLSALEQKLAQERADARTERLVRALAELGDRYDYALVDCPPNVGLLTFSALRAAGEVIVPLETSHFALHGVHKLLETISLLGERIGHAPAVRVLPTLYDGRTRFARDTLAEIRGLFGDLCFDTVIRCCVRLREAARRGVPIARAAARSNGALDYAALAVEVAAGVPAAVRPAQEDELRQVVVEFRDSEAKDVRLAGDFNGWVPDRGVESEIHREGDTRVWRKVLHLAPGTYEYRYVVDGEWRADPRNPDRVASSLGPPNSVLIVR
jgi:chromosome partitioning protein